MKIKEMIVNSAVEGFFLLRTAKVQTARNGNAYLIGAIADNSGEIELRMWDYALDVHEHVGSIIKVRGTVGEYAGTTQLVASKLRLAKDGEYNMAELVPTAPVPADSAIVAIESVVAAMHDPIYREISAAALRRMGSCAGTLPAAKALHHAFIGGWAMHTYHVMRLCSAVSSIYGDLVNHDLLLTGALCHDIAKRKEFVLAETGLVSEYSVPGALLGHLVMGAQEIADIAAELHVPSDDQHVILLQHMLISHHGNPEYGAAVLPKTIEAEILSRMDDLDAKTEIYRNALQTSEPGTLTGSIFGLGHNIYRPADN